MTDAQHFDPWFLAIWTALGALTALPLLFTEPRAFRRTCLIIGAVRLGTEVLICLPTLLITLPAGWKRPGLAAASSPPSCWPSPA